MDKSQIDTALNRLFHEQGKRIVFWNDPQREFFEQRWVNLSECHRRGLGRRQGCPRYVGSASIRQCNSASVL